MAELCFKGNSGIIRTVNLEDWNQVSYRFADLQWRWLQMRNISLKILFLFIAMAVFASPLVAMADDFCRCPECARGTCAVKTADCSSSNCAEEAAGSCCEQNAAISKAPGADEGTVADSSAAEPSHKSQTTPKDCRCSTYLCYDGNGIMPITSSVLSSTTDEFHQRIPKAFVTSGWVHQILHPPR